MKKMIGKIAIVVAVLIFLFLVIERKQVAWIWDNLTAPKDPFDEKVEDSWDRGQCILDLQYSEISATDYVNLYIPANVENPPLLVLVHGGGFVTNDNMSRQARLMINYFRDHGFAVASVNYRLAQETRYPAAILDVKAAVRYLRAHSKEYGYDAEHISIWGESAGGYLATMAALTNDDEFCDLEFIGQKELGDVSARVDVLIDFYGVVDMAAVEQDWKTVGLSKMVYKIANGWAMEYKKETGASSIESAWIGKEFADMTETEKNESTPLYYLEKNGTENQTLAIWITHGDSDITVPITQSERFYERAKNLKVSEVCYEVISHGKHADDRCYDHGQLDQIRSFIINKIGGEN